MSENARYFLDHSDAAFDLATDEATVHRRRAEPWRVWGARAGGAT